MNADSDTLLAESLKNLLAAVQHFLPEIPHVMDILQQLRAWGVLYALMKSYSPMPSELRADSFILYYHIVQLCLAALIGLPPLAPQLSLLVPGRI